MAPFPKLVGSSRLQCHSGCACKNQLPCVVCIISQSLPLAHSQCRLLSLYLCAETFGYIFLLLHASDSICAIEMSLNHVEECTLKLPASSVWLALHLTETGMHYLLAHMNLASPLLFHFGKLTVPGSQSQAAFGSNLLFVHLCSKGQVMLVSHVDLVLSNPSIFLSYTY